MTHQITSVSDLLTAVEATSLTHGRHAHVRVWFRGQGNRQWKLTPSIYRDGFAATENERLQKERHLTQDFRTMSASIRSFDTDPESYFVQQHYRMPTRLLDWSLSPLTALFFALEPLSEDGLVWILDAYRFKSDPPNRGLCTPCAREVQEVMSAIFDWNDAANWPEDILAIRPTNMDPRIVSQRGCFTLHPPRVPELTIDSNETLEPFIVPKAYKSLIRRELDLLGVDEFSIYGGLDSLADRLKRAYPLNDLP